MKMMFFFREVLFDIVGFGVVRVKAKCGVSGSPLVLLSCRHIQIMG